MSGRPFESQRSGFQRYLATSSTATAFNSTVFGATPTGGVILTPTQLASTNGLFPMGKSLISQFIFFGAGADNTTFDYRLWAAFRMQDASKVLDPNLLLHYVGGGSVTLSSITGPTGGTAILSTEKIADAVTWTISSTSTAPKGPTTAAETAFSEGTSGVYSPTSTTSEGIAQLIVPCAARAIGWVVDFDMTGATSGNCLIMSDDV